MAGTNPEPMKAGQAGTWRTGQGKEQIDVPVRVAQRQQIFIDLGMIAYSLARLQIPLADPCRVQGLKASVFYLEDLWLLG